MELSALLARMKLDHLDAQLDAVCEQAAAKDMDYKDFLAAALSTEWQGRYRRTVESRLKLARFPWIKTLETFDFDFQPSLDRRQVRELAGLSFVERGGNVVILGPPGVISSASSPSPSLFQISAVVHRKLPPPHALPYLTTSNTTDSSHDRRNLISFPSSPAALLSRFFTTQRLALALPIITRPYPNSSLLRSVKVKV